MCTVYIHIPPQLSAWQGWGDFKEARRKQRTASSTDMTRCFLIFLLDYGWGMLITVSGDETLSILSWEETTDMAALLFISIGNGTIGVLFYDMTCSTCTSLCYSKPLGLKQLAQTFCASRPNVSGILFCVSPLWWHDSIYVAAHSHLREVLIVIEKESFQKSLFFFACEYASVLRHTLTHHCCCSRKRDCWRRIASSSNYFSPA